MLARVGNSRRCMAPGWLPMGAWDDHAPIVSVVAVYTFTIQSDPDSVRDAHPGFAAPHPVAGAMLASVGMPGSMSGRFSPPGHDIAL